MVFIEDKGEAEDLPIVKELKELDDKYLAIEREYEKEMQALQKKYDTKRQPLLQERKDVLLKAEGEEEKTGTPACKGFWLKALQNHPAFQDVIEEWDDPVLEYITDVTCTDLDEEDSQKGFKLTFYFAENPYFDNTELVKEYHTEESSPYTGQIDTKQIKATKINWKPGKDVTVEKVQKKVKGGGAKKQKQKAKEKEESRPSFFRVFIRDISPGMELSDELMDEARQMGDYDEEDEDDEHDAIIEMLLEQDYEIGYAVKTNIIPYAVRWYTGEAAPEDDDEDEDEEEEEDDDDDDDDDSSDDSPAPKALAKGRARGGGGGKKGKGVGSPAPGEPKEECKQQ